MCTYEAAKVLVFALSLGIGAGACGSDDGSDDDGLGDDGPSEEGGADESSSDGGNQAMTTTGDADEDPDEPATFACGEFGECKATEEYCLLSITNGVESAQECIAMPSACTTAPSCDCVEEDAPEHSANCVGGIVSCSGSASNDGAEFTVSCESSL